MARWWRWNRFDGSTLVPVEVIRETETDVVYLDKTPGGHEVESTRSKASRHERYFPCLEDGEEWLRARASLGMVELEQSELSNTPEQEMPDDADRDRETPERA